MNSKNPHRLTLGAMFFALGLVLPFLTAQIPQIGNMLLPMHIPVFLCGLICGWRQGLIIGLLLPLTRSLLFGMPAPYPTAVAMCFELGAYGLFSGLTYYSGKYRCIRSLYRSLVITMLAGRAVWAAAMIVLMGIQGGAFTFEAFLVGAFLNAVPGIVLQLVLIPAVMLALDRTGLVRFEEQRT